MFCDVTLPLVFVFGTEVTQEIFNFVIKSLLHELSQVFGEEVREFLVDFKREGLSEDHHHILLVNVRPHAQPEFIYMPF